MRTKKVLFLLLLLVFFSITTGCLGGLFNNKPIIESIPETTAKVGIEYTYEIEATDLDADDVLTYSLTEKPTGMIINETTGAMSWTPTEAQAGDHQVTVEVSDGKVSVSQNFTITVAEALLTSIVVVPTEMTIYIGDSEDITSITAHYDNETTAVIELDSDDVSYSSDDEEIATVTDLGVVTGVSAGEAIITVSYAESYTEEDDITKTDTISVTVQEEPAILTAILVLPPFMSIYIGSEYSVTITSITAYYDDGSNAPIGLSSGIYSSNPTGIVTIDNSGVVTGVSAGTTTITVGYVEGGIARSDKVYVTVREVPVLTSITVLPVTMDIEVGDSDTITSITAHYSEGPNIPIALSSASYISDDTAVTTVGVNTGVVTGVSAGTAIITVSYTDRGITKTDTVAVTVVPE